MAMDFPEKKQSEALDWESLFYPEPLSRRTVTSQRLTGKHVLITGAAGSIGSALARSVCASAPESLVLLDTSENGLYQVDSRLREAGSTYPVPFLGSVCDSATLTHLFEAHRPQIVFHAAALKHVPLMEQNPFAAIATNAVGTMTLAKTAAVFQAEHLVLVSTDKAANPHSIMGASKRIAELALLAMGQTTGTRRIAVRLGNVAGSQGSVLPRFLDQIARGGQVTVTHPEAERYFISLDRTVEALFEALEFPPSPALVAPHLGAPIRILDLARYLLERTRSNATIQFTGLRPGDKMTESLLATGERWLAEPPANSTSLRPIASPLPAFDLMDSAVRELQEAAQTCDLPLLLNAVALLVPEYQPSSVIQATLAQSSMATDKAIA